MQRLLEPELLDHLAPEDPGAIRSRSDLRRINEWMGHPRIIARELKRHSPRTILELGAGDGSFMLRAAKLSGLRGVEITLLDRQVSLVPLLREKFESFEWKIEVIQSDVFEFLPQSVRQFDLVLCNLFLHHFTDAELQDMFRRIKGIGQTFLSCEPRRSGFSLLMARLLWIIRCNSITRHDAVISVRAGFRGADLANLWPSDRRWRTADHKKGVFTHFFEAMRISESP